MNYEQKAEVVAEANRRRGTISDTKGPEYAGQSTGYTEGTADVLANFKRNAEGTGLSAIVVAGVYAGKHWDSIQTFIREYQGRDSSDTKRALATDGEGIVSRLDDLRNYLDLFECILVDEGTV